MSSVVVLKMRPFSLLIKPAGPDCNLACEYCFYACKSGLFAPGAHRMSNKVLGKLVSDYLKLGFEINNFSWQGGEPILMGLDFYKKAVSLQQEHGRDGQFVTNSFQTNGVGLDEKWCRFLSKYKFLVGISLDGPKELHDFYRRDKAGKGTFDCVMAGIEICRANKVEFNILVLLNNRNVTVPDELFDLFVEHRVRFLQFIPCIEKDAQSAKAAYFSITAEQYGDFLVRIFDRWLEFGPEKMSIRLFDSLMSYYINGVHTNCTFAKRCNDYVVAEHNGDVFCCDFFVEERFKLGNLSDSSIGELFNSKTKRAFAQQKQPDCNDCLICRHFPICRGGCPKDRVVLGGDHRDPSFFCASYKQFFERAGSKLMELSALQIQADRGLSG